MTPTWLTYFQALGPSFVAIIAAGIAWSIQRRQVKISESVRDIAHVQSNIADQKLKLDLFQQRFKVLEEIILRITEVVEYGKSGEQHQAEFIKTLAPVPYLFSKEIYEKMIFELGSLIAEYMQRCDQIHATSRADPKQGVHLRKREALRDSLLLYPKTLHEKMGPYLKI